MRKAFQITVIAGVLATAMVFLRPAGAQNAPAASQQTGTVSGATPMGGTGTVVPKAFAGDKTIEQRMEEIVELAKKSTQDAHRYDISTLTCSEFLELSASDDPDDYAVMAMLMVWTHGYHSGLKGINFHAYPLDTQGIVHLTGQMASICRTHPKELFHVAALRLD